MVQLRWSLPVLAVLGLIGCREDQEGGTATAGWTSTVYAYTETGHSVSSTTTDESVLSRETELEALTNNYRVSIGLPALVSREDVRAVARAHSEHMITHAFFDHLNPEGEDPRSRALRAALPLKEYGENIAGGPATSTAEEAFNAFLNSETHRANIENPKWTAHGDGYAYGPGSRFLHYWTQNFLAPWGSLEPK